MKVFVRGTLGKEVIITADALVVAVPSEFVDMVRYGTWCP